MKLNFPEVSLTVTSESIVLSSSKPLAVLSTAMVGGGFLKTRYIVNRHVEHGYSSMEPEKELVTYAQGIGITKQFVGMMTAVKTADAGYASGKKDRIRVSAIVTAGLGNMASAGVTRPARSARAGTINSIILIDAELTPAAMVNAITTATEAKVKFLADHGVRVNNGHLGTGTSTDSIVLAISGRGEQVKFAGPATVAGWLIAKCVTKALIEALNKNPKFKSS